MLTDDQGDEQTPERRVVNVSSDPTHCARTNPKDITYHLIVSTEELRNGCVKLIIFMRDIICRNCMGIGGTPESTLIDCTTCSGKGFCVKWEVGNPILFNGYKICDICFGMGKRHRILCCECSGRRVVSIQQLLSVPVFVGNVDGQQIIFQNIGNQEPARETIPSGNVIVVLHEINDY